MPITQGTGRALYFGWAVAQIHAATAVAPIISQHVHDPAAIAVLGETLAILQASVPPLRPAPLGTEQLEASVADIYTQLRALTSALTSGSGDVAVLTREATAASLRALDTVEAFSETLQS